MQHPALFCTHARRRQDGSAVVEYALLVALMAIVLVVALGNTLSGLPATMQELAIRVGACISSFNGTC